MERLLPIQPFRPAPLRDVPDLPMAEFRETVAGAAADGRRLCTLFAAPGESGLRLYAVLTRDSAGTMAATSSLIKDRAYPALTPILPQAHLFEREIAEQWGVTPEGHPWLKPVRFRPPLDGSASPFGPGRPVVGAAEFFRAEGPEVHEVAVGPVHAGVIEPGHFRFQCHGEVVHHLEISLGYQYRGVEEALQGGPTRRSPHLMETLAGDTTIGHATAYCRVLESLAGAEVPARACLLRLVMLELERLANHVGDLGALAGDVGFLPTLSWCGRLRGDFLNLSALVCGSRFGRSMLRPGGVAFDLDLERLALFRARFAAICRDVEGALHVLWNSATTTARFRGTGPVSRQAALDLGLVGVAARACGVDRDCRLNFPDGAYADLKPDLARHEDGDVAGRALVRRLEVGCSTRLVWEALDLLEAGNGPVLAPWPGTRTAPDSLTVSLVEGWRGEICHAVLTDGQGRFARYKIADPSFHNWQGLALALRGQQISDFPLCNKSFNLSYCGHDL